MRLRYLLVAVLGCNADTPKQPRPAQTADQAATVLCDAAKQVAAGSARPSVATWLHSAAPKLEHPGMRQALVELGRHASLEAADVFETIENALGHAWECAAVDQLFETPAVTPSAAAPVDNEAVERGKIP